MICPECGEENQDSAKFCKRCGTSLNPIATMKKTNPDASSNKSEIKSRVYEKSDNASISNAPQSSFESNSKSGGDNKNLIIICLTVIICAVLIAGGIIFLSNNGSDDNAAVDSSVSLPNDTVDQSNDTTTVKTDTKTDAKTDNPVSNMRILGGSFSTGSSLSDKTYCSVYVGEEYAGENVKISVLYSRDGSNLNHGNVVPKTVSNDGYISVPSAYAFDKYPDNGFITIYDSNGNVLDTLDVSMSETSGKQTF